MEHSSVISVSIEAIWNWCQDEYLRHGINLSFPKNTDPQKTYQWRYLTRLAQKFIEWEFNEVTARKFLSIAVDYAQANRLLRKGLSVMFQSNFLKVCHDRMETEVQRSQNALQLLTETHNWLRSKIGAADPAVILLARRIPVSYCNLTLWFQASRIIPLYLALSKICYKVLSRLAPSERSLFPTLPQLYLIRSKFLEDSVASKQAHELFNNDWRSSSCL